MRSLLAAGVIVVLVACDFTGAFAKYCETSGQCVDAGTPDGGAGGGTAGGAGGGSAGGVGGGGAGGVGGGGAGGGGGGGGGWRQIAAGMSHSVALKADGTVWTWGSNLHGQLGGGTPRGTPAQVFSGARAIAAGHFHTLAIDTDGGLWVWGRNDFGQLGTGDTNVRSAPVKLGSPGEVRAAAGGRGHTLVVQEDGGLWSWGDNGVGALCDGTTTTYQPRQVTLAGPVPVAVSAGERHSVVRTKDDALWACGFNADGQLGGGTFGAGDGGALVSVQAAPPFGDFSAGGNHTLAVKAGDLYSWGLNNLGQLGNGSSGSSVATPAAIGASYARVSGGRAHNLAILVDGGITSWGMNLYGAVGNGVTGAITTPTVVALDAGPAAEVAAGGDFSLALFADGTLWAWGQNDAGQLGDGTWTDQPRPVRVRP